MRENNRNPIEKCRKKLPQFTTMNVIDGQAGLVIYSSLIFYSLTIDNILNIVILIILATVAINATFGENGLIKRAEEARDMTEEALRNEEQAISNAVAYMNEILGGAGGSETDDKDEPEKSEVEEAIDNRTEYENTTPIKDEYENTVYVPGGFHLAEDSGVVVAEGIVIEDSTNGNQFVWIPVGTYKISESESKTNNLSRRTFTSSGATEVTANNGDGALDSYFFGEGDSRSVASQTIGLFKTSALKYGGFYIGRYEQGMENVIRKNVSVYNNISRSNAITQAEALYGDNKYVTSELISSYAWDTTLNFICQINGYELATTTDSNYGNIGTSNFKNTGMDIHDNYNNIHDILGNFMEWTTEFNYSYLGVFRGGVYAFNGYNASNRATLDFEDSSNDHSFRTQLYIK